MRNFTVILALLSILLTSTYGSVQSAPETPDEPQALGIAHGAHLRPAVYYGQEVADFNSLVGKDLAAVMYFMVWDTSGLNAGEYFDNWLPRTIIDTFGANSPAIMLSWQPAKGSTPGCARNYSDRIPLNDIISGSCDTYIRGFAQALQTPPLDQLRFLIRFAHEMNLSESAWWPGHTGQDASTFVAAWRHVHDIFSQENVTNVEWVWAPNYESNPLDDWNDRNNYYPGGEYVDWIGVDGYNWGSPRWDTFSEIYDSSQYDYVLKDFACRYPKPQLITEFGSVDGAGSKANWITDAYSKIPNFPFVRGVFWFNDFAFANSRQPDFRVTSGSSDAGGVFPIPEGSNSWTNSYRNAISNPIYTEALPSLEAATPPTTYCQPSGPQFTASPAEITLKPGESSVHNITGIGYTSTQSLSLRTPSGSLISGSFSPASLPAPFGETVLTLTTSTATPPGVYPVVVQGNGVDLITIQMTVYQTYSISGKIKDQFDQGMTGVTVEYTSPNGQIRGSEMTRTNGTFLITNLPGSVYTITPNKSGFVFVPENRIVDLTSANADNMDFAAYPQPRLIVDHFGVGRPGSTFGFVGEDFPVDQTLHLYVNGIYHTADGITTDNTGRFSFSLNTGSALPGYYMVTMVSNPTQASIWFLLDENGEFWRDTPPSITILDETHPWSLVFLPSVQQGR